MKNFKKISKKHWILIVFILFIVILCVLFYKKDYTMCDAVKVYLKNADFEWIWPQVRKGDEIVVDYIGRLKDGNVFDTSIESIAKWCNKYNEHRDYSQWLWFIVWAWQMIAWFDRAVEWMNVGQTKTIEIDHTDAYGDWDEAKLMSVEKSKLDLPWQYKEWDVLYAPNWQAIRIHKVTDKEIFLDTNHELAGKTLIFDITIKEIK